MTAESSGCAERYPSTADVRLPTRPHFAFMAFSKAGNAPRPRALSASVAAACSAGSAEPSLATKRGRVGFRGIIGGQGEQQN